MAIYRLIKIFRSASAFAVLKPEKEWPTGCATAEQFEHHCKIVASGKIGGTIGFLAGMATAYELYLHPRHQTFEADDLFKIVLTPFLLTAAGMLSGACWAGVLAPRPFLQSPAGMYWATLIRAKSPDTSRGKLLIIAVITTGLFIFFAVCVAIDKV